MQCAQSAVLAPSPSKDLSSELIMLLRASKDDASSQLAAVRAGGAAPVPAQRPDAPSLADAAMPATPSQLALDITQPRLAVVSPAGGAVNDEERRYATNAFKLFVGQPFVWPGTFTFLKWMV